MSGQNLRVRLLSTVDSHVVLKRLLLLHLAPTELTLKFPLRFMDLHVLLQQLAISKRLKADVTPMLIREMNQILVLVHLPSVDKHQVALSALDIQRLFFVCISNMLLQVPLITESLSTEVAENLLEGWQSTSFPLVSLFMTAMVKDVTKCKDGRILLSSPFQQVLNSEGLVTVSKIALVWKLPSVSVHVSSQSLSTTQFQTTCFTYYFFFDL